MRRPFPSLEAVAIRHALLAFRKVLTFVIAFEIENPFSRKCYTCLRNGLLPMCPEYPQRAEMAFRKRAA